MGWMDLAAYVLTAWFSIMTVSPNRSLLSAENVCGTLHDDGRRMTHSKGGEDLHMEGGMRLIAHECTDHSTTGRATDISYQGLG